MELSDGSRVGVVGGGPAGTLTSYFLLDIAERVGLQLEVDIYESRDFSRSGPAGCNMCGGIISESLVQMLATEGINLPPSVVQRGIDSYVLHADAGEVRIRTPLEEKRIAALHRGSGPRGCRVGQWESFDGFLLNLACEKGANHLNSRVEEIGTENGKPVINVKGEPAQSYDLVVGAVGVNSAGKLFRDIGYRFDEPQTAKAYICEIFLGRDKVQEHLGNSMHVFLVNVPRLEFAALIPKGEYVTVCMLGQGIDRELVDRFMMSPHVRDWFPVEWSEAAPACRCLPRINVGGAKHFFADRIVLVGDCGVSRLYKDGIGAAYRTAKACAVTAVFHGVSKRDFQEHYWPTCRRLEVDNALGKLMFRGATLFRKLGFLSQAMLQTTRKEQRSESSRFAMSTVLWDMFTGSAAYRDVFLRCMKPDFVIPFAVESVKALFRVGGGRQ